MPDRGPRARRVRLVRGWALRCGVPMAACGPIHPLMLASSGRLARYPLARRFLVELGTLDERGRVPWRISSPWAARRSPVVWKTAPVRAWRSRSLGKALRTTGSLRPCLGRCSGGTPSRSAWHPHIEIPAARAGHPKRTDDFPPVGAAGSLYAPASPSGLGVKNGPQFHPQTRQNVSVLDAKAARERGFLSHIICIVQDSQNPVKPSPHAVFMPSTHSSP